jgi:hypothetical protein
MFARPLESELRDGFSSDEIEWLCAEDGDDVRRDSRPGGVETAARFAFANAGDSCTLGRIKLVFGRRFALPVKGGWRSFASRSAGLCDSDRVDGGTALGRRSLGRLERGKSGTTLHFTHDIAKS